MLKAEGPNLYHLSDEALKDRILTILHGMCSEGDELSEVPTMSQSVMDFIVKNDPGRQDFFGNINNWVNTVQKSETSISESSTINNQLFAKMDEHLETISLIMKELRSDLSKNLIELQSESISLRLIKVDEIIKIIQSKYPGICLDPFFNTGFIEDILANYSSEQLLSPSLFAEALNLINSEILLYLNSSMMF